VVEFVQESTELRSASSGSKTTAFCEQIDLGYARGTLMADDLDDAGHGVRAVKSALGAMNNLDFVDVIRSEICVDQVAARDIDRSAGDQHLGETGIAAVNEDRREAADRTGSRQADAGLCGKQIRKRNRLALLDLSSADQIHRGRSVVEILWLGIRSDHYVF